ERFAGRVDRRRRGRGAVLRVERGEEDAVAAGFDELLQLVADRRTSVAHGMGYLDRVAEARLEGPGLLRGDRRQRRAGLRPDLRIGARRLLRPCVEDDPAQDRLPD